jgi:hypothetical protein
MSHQRETIHGCEERGELAEIAAEDTEGLKLRDYVAEHLSQVLHFGRTF